MGSGGKLGCDVRQICKYGEILKIKNSQVNICIDLYILGQKLLKFLLWIMYCNPYGQQVG